MSNTTEEGRVVQMPSTFDIPQERKFWSNSSIFLQKNLTGESQTLLQNLTQLILHGEEIKQVIVKVTQNN